MPPPPGGRCAPDAVGPGQPFRVDRSFVIAKGQDAESAACVLDDQCACAVKCALVAGQVQSAQLAPEAGARARAGTARLRGGEEGGGAGILLLT